MTATLLRKIPAFDAVEEVMSLSQVDLLKDKWRPMPKYRAVEGGHAAGRVLHTATRIRHWCIRKVTVTRTS